MGKGFGEEVQHIEVTTVERPTTRRYLGRSKDLECAD